MYIPRYKIQNILKAYCQQMSRAEKTEVAALPASSSGFSAVSKSAQGRRQTIVTRVATDIVEKIVRFGSEYAGFCVDTAPSAYQSGLKSEDNGYFIFNSIDGNHTQSIRKLCLQHSEADIDGSERPDPKTGSEQIRYRNRENHGRIVQQSE